MIFRSVAFGAFLALAAPTAAARDSLAWVEPRGDVTLNQALALAEAGNPALQAKLFERRALEARQIKVTAFTNPELMVDVEDALGSGAYRGMNQGQITVQLEQSVELGGKRRAYAKAARAESETFAYQYEATKSNVAAQTAQAFTRLLSAQEEWALREEEVNLATQSAASLASQVQIGKLAPFVALRAKAEAGSARVALEWARHELDEAREALAAQWGSHPPRFAQAVGAMDCGPPPPPLESLLVLLRLSPKWKAAEAQIEASRAHAAVEKAHAFPALSLRAGYRRLSGPGENAAVAGLSLPLPLFQRNESRIQESRQRIAKSQSEADATQLDLIEALAEAHDVMLTAHSECALLRDSVLPAAKAAYENIQPGFQGGRYSHFELWDAHRAYLAARLQWMKSRALYHKSKSELEGLLASDLNTLNPPEKGNSP